MVRGAVIAFVVAILAAAGPAAADTKRRKKAREHFNQGEMYMQAAVYDLAIQEYRLAYTLVPTAHGFLFNIGLAFQRWGKPKEALAEFRSYLKKQPRGAEAPETKARIIALERELSDRESEDAARKNAFNAHRNPNGANATTTKPRESEPDPPKASGATKDASAAKRPAKDERVAKLPGAAKNEPRTGRQPARVPERSRAPRSTAMTGVKRTEDRGQPPGGSRVKWGWLAAGAGLVGAGLLIDVGLDSSRNGSVDVMDFAPLALYSAGGVFVIRGVF